MTLQQEKAAWFVLLTFAVSALYLGTAQSEVFPAVTMAASALDQRIPFLPGFVFAYVTLFPLIPLPLLAIHDREELRNAVAGFCVIVSASCITFFFWPTAIPDGAWTPLIRDLLSLDSQRNACPSLHASLALYCSLWLGRRLESKKLKLGLALWAGLVIASPLLIKRHVVADVAAGAALGWIVYFVFSRSTRAESPDTAPVLETLRIRRELERDAPEQIRALLRLDVRRRLRELALFVALAACGFLVSVYGRAHTSTLVLLAGIGLTAVALNSLVLLMHEGMHGALFRNRIANRVVSFLLGASFLMSFSAYRVMHIRHHRYLGDARDPDDYKNYSSNPLVVWTLHFVRLTLGSLLYLFLIPLLALKYGSRRDRRRICFEYVGLLALYSFLVRLVSPTELFVVWIVPLLLTGAMTAIRGFAQHGITDATDPYIASRTMLPHPVVQFFLLNENYHLEHHLFPEAPSYHLDELHRVVWPKLPRAVAAVGYLEFLFAFLKATPRMDETPIGLVSPGDSSP